MNSFYKYTLWAALISFIAILVLWLQGNLELVGPFIILCFLLLSLGFRGHRFLKGFSFTVLIFASVSAAMFYPDFFVKQGSFEMKLLIVPLLQIIMFGMGTTMSLGDFAGVIKMPKGVLVGLLCQYSIMPVVGFTLATLFGFPPEIAAGVILIGSSPSGLASNVMTYLAKANLALSVTLTAVSTLLAPLTTPLLMELFAGQFVPIDFWAMMWSITKIVILPIVAGLIFNRFFHGKAPWLDKAMPIVSMAGIAIIITIITAAGRDSLLAIGLALVAAAIIHNGLGYFLGYWGCRLLKLPERDCRTIALEVGMQNGGLASGIALEMGKVATIGLAPAVFGPWMNISGSSLATWWGERDPEAEPAVKPVVEQESVL
ncbi:MAG: sodium transporter [Cyclobacteriaceae bacterium]|nr:MAG: sodium transporter [Cyclobacteriaceae bacterium]